METNEISKKEFWLGIAIIALCIISWNFIEPFPIESTADVDIRPEEVIICETSEDGVVECD